MSTQDCPDAARPVPLDYATPGTVQEIHRQRRRAILDLCEDWAVGLMALSYLAMVPLACHDNLADAPMNGGGSCYTLWALCNEAWQRAHPRAARFIMDLPSAPLEALAIPMFFGSIFSYGALPLLLVPAALAWRLWTNRRRRWRFVPLLLAATLYALAIPQFYGVLTIILD